MDEFSDPGPEGSIGKIIEIRQRASPNSIELVYQRITDDPAFHIKVGQKRLLLFSSTINRPESEGGSHLPLPTVGTVKEIDDGRGRIVIEVVFDEINLDFLFRHTELMERYGPLRIKRLKLSAVLTRELRSDSRKPNRPLGP